MNKYQDALDYLIKGIEMLNRHSDGSFCEAHYSKKVLQKLVNKATPKKISHTKEKGIFTFNFGRCECGKKILSVNDYVKYCPNCGQPLDWRVEDD